MTFYGWYVCFLEIGMLEYRAICKVRGRMTELEHS